MYEYFLFIIDKFCEAIHKHYGCNSYCYWSCQHETFV